MTNADAKSRNPLLAISSLDFHYPAFDEIQDTHFAEAFDIGMQLHRDEITKITENEQPASFDNTLIALEKSGQILKQAWRIFCNLVSADTNNDRQALQARYAPVITAHFDSITLNKALFERIDALYQQQQSLALGAESLYLLKRYHHHYIREGARLDDAKKARLQEINAQLAKLATSFMQNVLAEVNDSAVLVESRDELDGLTEEQISAASEAATNNGKEGKYLLRLVNTTGQPVSAQLMHRPTRERLYKASFIRGTRSNQWETLPITADTLALRAERSQLLGFETHASYVLSDRMAGDPTAVNDMLSQLIPPAVSNAKKEAAALQAVIDEEQAKKGEPSFALEAWDWEFYSDILRKTKYALDDSEIKPYFELRNVLEKGAFYTASELYGLSFKERDDLPKYHPDIWTYDVFDQDGSRLAIFIFDPYARASKYGGAWMNNYVSQSTLLGKKPVVANHLNVVKPAEGKPTLLSWDEVTTLFHEFGHALHGMFSNVTYPYFSGTSVPTDFVEFPSQFNEMWAKWPSVLNHYARHYETNERIPDQLLEKMKRAETLNQGFAITEYLGAAFIDQHWHQLHKGETPQAPQIPTLEKEALAAARIDYSPVPPRYHTPYFSHIMGGYGSGYYSYVWAEVLDADAEEWFINHGGLNRHNGDQLRQTVFSRGGSEDAITLFRDFHGEDPKIEPLLRKRGLI